MLSEQELSVNMQSGAMVLGSSMNARVPTDDAAITPTAAPSMILASAVVLPQASHESSVEEAETDDRSSVSSLLSSLGVDTYGREEGNDDLVDLFPGPPAENAMSTGVVYIVTKVRMAAASAEREQVLEAREAKVTHVPCRRLGLDDDTRHLHGKGGNGKCTYVV